MTVLYYTELQGVSIDFAGDPPTAQVNNGSARANFQYVIDRSVGFESLTGTDPGTEALSRGDPVSLSGDSGVAPVGDAIYAGAGTLQSSVSFIGYPAEVETRIHPVEGHFLVSGSPGDPQGQKVYFVTGFPLDRDTVGYDLSCPPELELTDVRIADLATTPPLDGAEWDGLRASLMQLGYRGIQVSYDPEGTFPLLPVAPPPCFTPGTLIETAQGPRLVETLTVGTLVVTADHGLQPVRWAGRVTVSAQRLRESPGLRPIRIRAGALGAGLPRADLLVSPQHRVLVRSPVAARMFMVAEVLLAARQLVGLPGISVAEAPDGVVYLHLLFDRHELIWSNGAVTESLYAGPQALAGLGAAARREILTLFPTLREQPVPSARLQVPGRRARRLTQRHLANRRPLLA